MGGAFLFGLLASGASAGVEDLAALLARSGDRGEPSQSFSETFSRAAAGDPEAQVGLARRYEVRGGELFAAEAVKWYGLAAEQGDRWAMRALIRLGLRRGDRAGSEAAAAWARRAARAGDPVATYALGVLYREGRGVERDGEQALAWIKRAAEGGLAAAQADLDGNGRATESRAATSHGAGSPDRSTGGAEKAIGSRREPTGADATLASAVALPDRISTVAPGAVGIDVLANDLLPPGSGPAVSLASDPAGGTARVVASGRILYRPRDGFSGLDLFAYRLRDGDATSTALIIVDVRPAPIPRSAAPGPTAGAVPPPAANRTDAEDPPAAPAPTDAASAGEPDGRAASLAEVGAELMDLLAAMPCADVRAAIDGDRRLRVSGRVPSPAYGARIERALAERLDADAYAIDLDRYDRRYCAALDVLGRHAGAGPAGGGLVVAAPAAGARRPSARPAIELRVAAAAAPDGVVFDHFRPDGMVAHSAASTAGGAADGAGKTPVWRSGPVVLQAGGNLVAAIVAPRPLFARPRPPVEPTEVYVAALRRAVSAVAAGGASAPVLTRYRFVEGPDGR